MATKRVLVTGASGFVGRPCSLQLRARGFQVVTTDLVGSVDIKGDLAEPSFCSSNLPDVDVVVHCAAVQYVSKNLPSFGRRSFFERNNVVATEQLVRRFARPDVHFVNVGTSMMYRQSGQPLYQVTDEMGGGGAYSESKDRAWKLVAERPGPNACVIPCIIAGRGREGLFRSFVGTMHRLGMVIIPGAGEHPVHMVHVDDMAALLVRVIESGASGLINVAGEGPLSISEWVGVIESELGINPVRRIHLPLAPLHYLSALLGYVPLAREQLLMLKHAHVLDVKEALALGWQPQHSNAQIVAETARAIVTAFETDASS